jgi:hypothetical protein
MLWNHLDYSLQVKVIDRIVDLLRDEDDDLMQDGLIAAVHELEVWSNTPCQIMDGDTILAVEPDPFCEKGWDE